MSIDWWTLGIQTVNVVVLIWLLERFFWTPVAAMIEQRRVTTQGILAEAKTKRSQADAALAEVQRARGGFVKEREAILAAAQEAAASLRTTRLAEAAKEVAALEAASKAANVKEKAAAEAAFADRASHLAVAIAERLAARLDGPAVRAAFLDWLLVAIKALPDADRQAMAATEASLEAVSATPLDPADQERIRDLIGQVFGSHPQIAFEAEPALIAGLELRTPHLVVGNSWRADLIKILADLKHEH